MAEVFGTAAIAALVHHHEQPRGGERRELGQRLEEEGTVRIDPAGPQRRGLGGQPRLREHALHGAAVHVQLSGDGAHAPVLGFVQAQDLRAQFRGYGHGAPPTRPLTGAGSPGGPRARAGRRIVGMSARQRARRASSRPGRGWK